MCDCLLGRDDTELLCPVIPNRPAKKLADMQADLEEKRKQEPPRLGRHRFQPLRPQVLTSDDVTGSLRTLRTTPQVAKDRYNSLQKRGVIQVLSRAMPTIILSSW